MTNKNAKINYSVIQGFLGDLRKWNREHEDYTAQDVINDMSAVLSEYLSETGTD